MYFKEEFQQERGGRAFSPLRLLGEEVHKQGFLTISQGGAFAKTARLENFSTLCSPSPASGAGPPGVLV